MSVVYVGIVCILRHLKEELAWATDIWLWVIRNIVLFKTVMYTVGPRLSEHLYATSMLKVFRLVNLFG